MAAGRGAAAVPLAGPARAARAARRDRRLPAQVPRPRRQPEQVLVTQGVSSGLALLADALLTPGDKAGVEEPGYPTAREVLRRAGAQVVPCRVDAHGIVPEELPGDLRLLYTTPAHQYPLGGRLPVSRRQALIAWARATGAVVVEDDYDSEFRYDVGPLPALYSMDPDVIVYLGTASKALATAFGAGWLVAPPALVDALARCGRASASGSLSRCSTPCSRCSARATWSGTSARCAWSTPAAAPPSSTG